MMRSDNTTIQLQSIRYKKYQPCNHNIRCIILLLIFAINIRLPSLMITTTYASITVPPDHHDNDEHDDEDALLAEILAEEKREAEELSQLEAEMRELEALKYQRQQQEKQHQQQQNGMYKNKMGYNTKPSSNISPGSSSTTSNNQNLNQLENELLKKQAEMDEAKRQANIKSNEEAIQKKNEAIAKQREEAFEAELAKIRDENLKKKMQRQKQQDAKVVKRVLHNYAKGRHYAVLGFKIVCSMFGEMQVFGLPYLKVCSMNTSQIKSAYRQSAKLVHPDKNRDGHAAEAFDALEKSASLLLDPVKKKEYDLKLKRQRKELVHSFVTLIDSIRKSVVSFVDVARKVLGPFATPFLILFAVIV